tara:strand:- start:1396 stop:2769 length:1374 start_codon:yes stop_codon:yes gene_type:complete
MRFFQFNPALKEAKGIFGRKPGDPFVDAAGTEAEFISAEAYPPMEQGGRFASPEERDANIAEYEKKHQLAKGEIKWTNLPKSNSLAYGIAIIKTSNKTIYFGRYLQSNSHDLLGIWPNQSIPDGWKLQTKGAQKLETGLDPQTLIGTGSYFTGTQNIINHVNNKAPANDKQVLTDALTASANGQLAKFPGQIDRLEAIRDYFGEIMGPVAMMGGAVLGPAEQARKDLAGGANWSDLQIFWPQSMNYNLMDSVFIAPDGKQIGISSKGGTGAAASAKNLYDSLKKNEQDDQLMKNVQFIKPIIEIIAQKSAKEAPFILGERFKITTPALHTEAKKLMSSGANTFDGLSDEATKMVTGINFDQRVQGFNAGYALTSAVAKKVALKVNEDSRFSVEAIRLLNTASIVQLYTRVGKKGDDVFVSKYDAVYPPNFSGTVALDGSKNYYSSRIGGKFAFRFVK